MDTNWTCNILSRCKSYVALYQWKLYYLLWKILWERNVLGLFSTNYTDICPNNGAEIQFEKTNNLEGRSWIVRASAL